MELPHIGQHCALQQCNQLDFLPVKCDACSEVFCLEHYRYERHQCETASNKDFQVPVCPMCMEPVVSKRDQPPDLAVSQHIDQFCAKNELLKNYQPRRRTNLQACNFKLCKQKDLIYLECADCKSKFCIKHRHPTDHSCVGPAPVTMGASIANNWNTLKDSCSSNASSSFSMIRNKAQQMTKSGQMALQRIAANAATAANRTAAVQSNRAPVAAVNSLQGNLSEQEALAIAIRESASNGGAGSASQPIVIDNDDDDAALARAIHESEAEARNRSRATTTGSQKDTCILS